MTQTVLTRYWLMLVRVSIMLWGGILFYHKIITSSEPVVEGENNAI